MDIFILTAGSGGDYAGAQLIQERLLEQGHSVTLQTTKEVEEKDPEQLEKYNRILVIGQLAAIHASKNPKSLPQWDKICVYAHLLNKNLVDSIAYNLGDKAKDTRFMTTSASYIDHRLKYGLAIRTVNLNGELSQEALSVALLALSLPTIHLGGSYKSSENFDIQVDNEDYITTLANLPIHGTSVSVILHPRVFSECTTEEEKQQRLLAINEALLKKGIKEVYFYAGKFTINNKLPKEMPSEIQVIALEYNDIIKFANKNPDSLAKQFISADQYNAFADFGMHNGGNLVAFYLKQSDKEQSEYVDSILRSSDLTEDIISFCKKTHVEKLNEQHSAKIADLPLAI